MVETILLALFLAKLRGYKIKPLFKDWPIYLVGAFALSYIALEVAVFRGNYSLVKYANIYKGMYIAVFIGMVIKYNLNKSAIVGSIFAFIGSALNNIAITSNGGKMPVFPSTSYLTGYVNVDTFSKVSDIHILGSNLVNNKILTDVIDLGYTILSLGDVFIRVLPFLLVFYAVKSQNEKVIS